MGMFAMFIGVPATLILVLIGVLFIRLGKYLYNKMKHTVLKVFILFLSCLPIAIISSLYIGGISTVMFYWYGQGVEANEIFSTLLIAMLIGSYNIISPGSIPMGDNGPAINTFTATTICFILAIFSSIYLVIKHYKKIKERLFKPHL